MSMTEQKNNLSNEKEENSQTKPILSALIWISWGTYLVAFISGLYWGDKKLILVTIISFVFLVIPFLLLRRGNVRASGYLLVLMVLVMVTLVATIGQGIRDLAILAFPIIIVFASLALDRLGFRIFVLLTFIAIAWLVFGEVLGLYVPESYETPGLIDFLIITGILGAAALSVNLLTSTMRKNLDQAHLEIVQRKQIEGLLRASEERFTLSMDATNDGLWDWDIKTRGGYFSPGYYRMLGYEIDEFPVNSNYWESLIHPDDRENTFQKNSDCIEGRCEHFEVEYRMKAKNGEWRWILGRGKCITRDDQGRATRLVGTHVDITERKNFESALLEGEKKYRGLFQGNKDGIAIFLLNPNGPPGTFVEVNDAAPKMLGYSREEMLLLTPLMLEPFTSQEQLRIRQSEFESKGIVNFETILLHKDGHPIITEFTAQYIEYEGKPAIMNVVRDVTERTQREKELQAIASLSASLRSAPNRMEMLPVIVEQLSHILNCDSILFQIIDEQTQDAVVEGAYGEWSSTIGSHQPNNTGLNTVLRETMEPYLNNNIKEDPRFMTLENVNNDNIIATAGVPLVAQDQVIGFLWMGGKKEITESEFRLLIAVADIAANAIHRSTLHERTLMHAVNLSQAYDSTLEGWAHALELRDQETEGHARKVVQKTLDLAKRLGISNNELEHVRRGALLHDIGKMGIPDSVLLKPGTLNEREWEIMRRHPEYANNLMHPIEYLHPALDIPYCHHEKWDGSGYPRGLKGEEIPLVARIFAIVDVWDALMSNRPYRKSWSKDQANEYLRAQAGKHFDPSVVNAFLEMIAEG
jgi:PAS domain S-box-containing protein